MRAVIDDHGGDPQAFRPFGQHRRTKRKGGGRKTPMRRDPDHPGPVVQQFRNRLRLDLSGGQRAQVAVDAVDAVGFAAVTLARDDDRRDRFCLLDGQTGFQKDLGHDLVQRVDGQGGLRHVRLRLWKVRLQALYTSCMHSGQLDDPASPERRP